MRINFLGDWGTAFGRLDVHVRGALPEHASIGHVERGHRAVAGALREAASRAGGHATLFIAGDDPSALGIDRFEPLKAPLDRIHRRLKAEFDPSGLFNRGRLLPEHAA